MKDVDLDGSDQANQMNQALTQHPIQFAMEERRVQHVCSHANDPIWVTNLKKSVISSFQQQLDHGRQAGGINLTETDVVGTCQTEYVPNSDLTNPNYVKYQKIKHMETCQDNQKLYQFALNLPDMNIQNLPMIKYVHA